LNDRYRNGDRQEIAMSATGEESIVYCDTALVDAVLGDPADAVAATAGSGRST
jgi:hypothetical protein